MVHNSIYSRKVLLLRRLTKPRNDVHLNGRVITNVFHWILLHSRQSACQPIHKTHSESDSSFGKDQCNIDIWPVVSNSLRCLHAKYTISWMQWISGERVWQADFKPRTKHLVKKLYCFNLCSSHHVDQVVKNAVPSSLYKLECKNHGG